MELTPSIINAIFENILRGEESVRLIPSTAFDSLLKNFISEQILAPKYVLVESQPFYTLWLRSAWLRDVEKKEKDAADRKEYSEILEENREAFMKIRLAICELVGNSEKNEELINLLASKALANKSKGAKELAGIDLDNIRSLPKKHTVMGGEKGDYVL